MEGRKTLDSLYHQYDIERKHDDPSNSLQKYPPDWNYRQAAILDYNRETCGRCRRSVGSGSDSLPFHIHHIIPLHKRGKHHLKNLVSLCEDCHALMHPDNEKLGDWKKSPLFPAYTADYRVAVERVPLTDFERAVYDDRSDPNDLEATGDVNIYARSEATTDVPADIAVQKKNPTREELNEMDTSGPFEFFCVECNKMVNPSNKRCKACTAPTANLSKAAIVGGLLVVTFVTLLILFFLFL